MVFNFVNFKGEQFVGVTQGSGRAITLLGVSKPFMRFQFTHVAAVNWGGAEYIRRFGQLTRAFGFGTFDGLSKVDRQGVFDCRRTSGPLFDVCTRVSGMGEFTGLFKNVPSGRTGH